MRGRIIAMTVIVGTSLLGPSQPHADPVRYDWRIEDGIEYDSNPARSERIAGSSSPSPPGSALGRLVASGSLAAPLSTRHALALTAALGGKWFVEREARAENVLVVQAGASDAIRLARRTVASPSVAYYDVFQRRSTDLPDFRSVAPSLRLDQGLAQSVIVSLGAGHRWFTFKPDHRFSFAAPTAFISIRHGLLADLERGGADWDFSAGGSLELRRFEGPACTSQGCDGEGSDQHRDRFWIAHAEMLRTTSWLLGGGAAMHLNQSNSYGESLLRALLHVRAVVPLPGELSLSARGELVLTRYDDPVTFLKPVAGLPSASIEDESRSTARIELSRVFDGHVEIGARYVYYTSAPTSGDVTYGRQTLLLYLAVFDER